MERARGQWAVTGAHAEAIGGSNEPLGDHWFDAIAHFPEQAPGLKFDSNAARLKARVVSRLGLR